MQVTYIIMTSGTGKLCCSNLSFPNKDTFKTRPAATFCRWRYYIAGGSTRNTNKLFLSRSKSKQLK